MIGPDTGPDATGPCRVDHGGRIRRPPSRVAWSRVVSLGLLVLGIGAATVRAQSEPPSTWAVTPFVGRVFAGDLGRSATTFGVALSLRVAGPLGLEGELGYAPDLDPDVARDVSTLMVSGHLLYHFLAADRPVAPYASVGGALVRLATGVQDVVRSVVELAVTAGGGATVRIGRGLRVRADLRFVHVDNAPNFWRASGGLTVGLTPPDD